MNPTRIEIDLPIVIINQYGKLQLDNLKDIEDVIAASFNKGTVLNIHVVAEDTGATRGFCTFVSETNYGKSKCGFVLHSDGTCWRDDEHNKERVKQLELVEAEDAE